MISRKLSLATVCIHLNNRVAAFEFSNSSRVNWRTTCREHGLSTNARLQIDLSRINLSTAVSISSEDDLDLQEESRIT